MDFWNLKLKLFVLFLNPWSYLLIIILVEELQFAGVFLVLGETNCQNSHVVVSGVREVGHVEAEITEVLGAQLGIPLINTEAIAHKQEPVELQE